MWRMRSDLWLALVIGVYAVVIIAWCLVAAPVTLGVRAWNRLTRRMARHDS